MNIEAYNLDSLRKLVRDLQKENRKLKNQLNKANIAYDSESIFDERIESAVEYDPDQGERIIGKYITEELAKKFFAMFWGRIFDLTFKHCLAQLTVSNPIFAPYQYVDFEAMARESEKPELIYFFYDSKEMTEEEVFHELEVGIQYCSGYIPNQLRK